MARAEPRYRFTVESSYPFPMDMLRYDRCFPEDTVTADRMALSHSFDPPRGRQSYTLIGAQGWQGPSADRWDSFMFKVTNIEEMR